MRVCARAQVLKQPAAPLPRLGRELAAALARAFKDGSPDETKAALRAANKLLL